LHGVDGDVLQRVFGGCLLYFAKLNDAEGAEARAVTYAGAGAAGAGAAGMPLAYRHQNGAARVGA
jgi:hypothetical protein